jgi:hypothetical protein
MRCYHDFVPVRKLSIALDEDVAERAAAAAMEESLSLSAWLNRAAENFLALKDGLAAVREWEAEHGRFSAQERARADAVLDGASRSRAKPKRRLQARPSARSAG